MWPLDACVLYPRAVQHNDSPLMQCRASLTLLTPPHTYPAGQYDPVWEVDEMLTQLNSYNGWQVGIHVDAAS
eukprot:183614-Chlamydomonas_euryale.AAC.2